MIYTVVQHLALIGRAAAGALRDRARGREADVGASALELVIIVLGLMTLASLVVAAVTHAVQSRVAQIH